MASGLVLISPVFNDWDCAVRLLADIRETFHEGQVAAVVFVNDGSVEATPTFDALDFDITVLDVKVNLGHQRAIALGLVHAVAHFPHSLIAVLDSDGEDLPRDLPDLIRAHASQGCGFAVAERVERKESSWFRALYAVYKAGFRTLTGQEINFGNFVVMDWDAASRLVYMPETWNSFPGAVLQSRLPLTRVPIARGRRYFGASKMNFVSLVNHGLAAMSAFTERIFVRFTVALLSVLGLLVVGAVALIAIRVFTTVAIPGWTSTLLGLLFISVIQILAVTGVLVLIQASSRSSAKVVPVSAAALYLPRDSRGDV